MGPSPHQAALPCLGSMAKPPSCSLRYSPRGRPFLARAPRPPREGKGPPGKGTQAPSRGEGPSWQGHPGPLERGRPFLARAPRPPREGKALPGKGTQAPSRGEGPTWGSLWQQLGLHSVPFPTSQDKPGSVPEGGASLLPVTAPKASEVSLNQAQNSNGPRPAPPATGPRADILSRAAGNRQARPPPIHARL